MLAFDAQLRENELKMRKDMANDAAEMLEAAGYREVKTYDREIGVGLGIHEMGTARMGKRSEDLGAQRVEPGARVQERVRHRRFLHDVEPRARILR